MSSRLPENVDPRRLASQGTAYSGTVNLDKLDRLSDALKDASGQAEFSITFYRDNRKRARIKGQVKADLVLECQRCLGELLFPVTAELDLAVIKVPEEAEHLPDSCEPVWVEEETLRLLNLVEDELILAIPQVPRHEDDACDVDWENPVDDIQAEQEDDLSDKKPNPFAVLAGLKSDK